MILLSKTVGTRNGRKYSCIAAHWKKDGRGSGLGGGGGGVKKKNLIEKKWEKENIMGI
jgi:hypothetical protein